MSEYKSITSTIKDIFTSPDVEHKTLTKTIQEITNSEKRAKIKTTPRPNDPPRKEQESVARVVKGAEKPDSETSNLTKEGEIDKVDENLDPSKVKHPEKIEAKDVGKTKKATKVVINPEIDKSNIFSSVDKPEGKLVEDEKSKKEAEHIANFAKQFQGKSVGGFKVTGTLTDKHIAQGAAIRAKMNALRKEETLIESDPIDIQYQTNSGQWVTARKSSTKPSDIIMAMRSVRKAYSENRVRAVDPRGALIDMLGDPPQKFQEEQLNEIGWVGEPEQPSALGGIAKLGVGYLLARHIARKYQEKEDNRTRQLVAALRGKPVSGPPLNPSFYSKWKKSLNPFSNVWRQERQKKIIDEGKSNVTFRNTQKVKDATNSIGQKAKPTSDPEMENLMKRVDAKKKQVTEANKPKREGLEVMEPKFSDSIQKVAAHARIYADVEHTYKHRDGSKTRVNQELGEKIHNKIHSTPNRHRAKLIQHIHRSADNLKNALKEETLGEMLPFAATGVLKAASDKYRKMKQDKKEPEKKIEEQDGLENAASDAKKAWPKVYSAMSKMASDVGDLLIKAPTMTTFATQKDVLPASITTDYIAKNKAKAATDVAKEERIVLPDKYSGDHTVRKIYRDGN